MPSAESAELREGGRSVAKYNIQYDRVEITRYRGDGGVSAVMLLGSGEAEKLYHFLGGLYG
jgi:hypothetical protein